MIIQQGSTYELAIELRSDDGIISASDIIKAEFVFGNIVKNYPEEVTHDGVKFIMNLTQEETFSLSRDTPYQARVKFADGTVKGSPILFTDHLVSLSKEVL